MYLKIMHKQRIPGLPRVSGEDVLLLPTSGKNKNTIYGFYLKAFTGQDQSLRSFKIICSLQLCNSNLNNESQKNKLLTDHL